MTEIQYPPGIHDLPDNDGETQMRPDDRPHSIYGAEMTEIQHTQLSEDAETIVDAVIASGFATFEDLNTAFDIAELSTEMRRVVIDKLDELNMPIQGVEIPKALDEPENQNPQSQENIFNMSAMKTILIKAGQLPLLTAHQEKVLAYHIQRGDINARNKMIEHNLRLVAKFIKPYLGQGLDDDDLFMEGVIGLTKAAEKFDPELNYRFSTYAADWIKQTFQRAVANYADTIRVPLHVRDRSRALFNAKKHLQDDKGPDYKPTVEELADYTGMKEEQVREAEQAFESQPVSLNKKIGEDFSAEYGDILGPNAMPREDTVLDFVDEISQAEKELILNEALRVLDERDLKLLQLRFGIHGSKALSLVDVGIELGVSFQRIQQLEVNALAKLESVAHLREITHDPDNFEPDIPINIEGLLEKKGIDRIEGLSAKDTYVAYLLYSGKNNLQIAKIIGENVGVVKVCIRQIYKKFGIPNNISKTEKRPLCLSKLSDYFSAEEELAA